MKPLVSIVTPSYNHGRFIEDAILSIKNQTYPNIEHIIVDACSTDQTLEVIRSYDGTYNMRWISEPDEGMYNAVNKGLRMAKGEIFAYLNCDDCYFPWSVAMAVKHLEKNELIFGDLLRINFDTNEIMFSFTPPFISAYYRAAGIINQPTVFFSRSVVDKIGYFDEKFYNLGDVEYWLRCNSLGVRIGKVWEILALDRWHKDSLSCRNRDRHLSEMECLRKIYGDWKTHFILPFRLINHLYWRMAIVFYVLNWPVLWARFKESHIVNLSWLFWLRHLLPGFVGSHGKGELLGDEVLASLRASLMKNRH